MKTAGRKSFLASPFPLLSGWAFSHIAFALLLVPEGLFRVIRSPETLSGEELTMIASLFGVASALFAFAFQICHILLRVLGALASHLDKLWTAAAGGVFLFLIAFQPLLSLLPSMGFPLPLVGIPVVAALLYFFPAFRGRSAVLLVFSALASRLLLLPCDPTGGNRCFVPEHAPTDVAVYEICALILAAAWFFAAQLRYRAGLSPSYELVRIPRPAVATTLVLLVLFLSAPVALLLAFPGDFESTVFRSLSLVSLLVAGGLALCLFTAMSLNRVYRSYVLHGHPKAYFAGLACALLAALSVLSFVRLRDRFEPGDLPLNLMRHGLLASEMLHTAAVFLDNDGDGHSLWPGRDPDDNDPCNPLPLASECEPPKGRTSLKTQIGPVAQFPELLVFFSSTKPLDAHLETTYEAKLLSISDETPRALRAFLQGLGGIEEWKQKRQASLFSLLTREGYRTICLGQGDYFSLESSFDLDAGCQIFQQQAGDPKSMGKEALSLLSKYGEERTALWLHYEAKQEMDLTDLMFALPKKDTAIASLSLGQNLVARLRVHGAFPFVRSVFHVPERRGLLKRDLFSNLWAKRLRKETKHNFLTYTYRNGELQVFDGLTGSGWELPAGHAPTDVSNL